MSELEEIKIESLIYNIRGKQVMLDSDVAILFGYSTKDLNRNVKNNINRFPEDYCFKLTEEEYNSLRCKNFTLKNGRGEHRKYLPYVFTEYGITMLAGILKSDIAVAASLKIVNTFISMRKYIKENIIEQAFINEMVLRHEKDIKLLQKTFDKLEESKNQIFFDGQIYDSYSKIIDIMSIAKNELIIIDSYADKVVLDMISKINVKVILITKTKTLLRNLDIEKYNMQYNNLNIIYDDTFHDRYLIIDKSVIYHLGTSINHIGSKTFSINKLEDSVVIESLLNKLKNIIK